MEIGALGFGIVFILYVYTIKKSKREIIKKKREEKKETRKLKFIVSCNHHFQSHDLITGFFNKRYINTNRRATVFIHNQIGLMYNLVEIDYVY